MRIEILGIEGANLEQKLLIKIFKIFCVALVERENAETNFDQSCLVY